MPEYDRCVLIVEADTMYCFPINQPGKPGYYTPLDKSKTGWFAVSPEDFEKIVKALNEAREKCGGS